MDVRNGNIYELEEALGDATNDAVNDLKELRGKLLDENEELNEEDMKYLKGVLIPPTPYQRQTKKVGRNDPCPCGKHSLDGKPMKFKKCCLRKE